MKPFRQIGSVAVPLLRDNVNTDAIIPSREMKSTGRTGLAEGLFAPWRYVDADSRTADPQFPLNQERARGAQVLLGGANFGCGSSREHAVWALLEYGIRCIIAPGFAPIFQANCLRNGLLVVTLDPDAIRAMEWQDITVDLEKQEIISPAGRHAFAIDVEARDMLLEGLDAIELTFKHGSAIEAWTNRDRTDRPWVYLEHKQ